MAEQVKNIFLIGMMGTWKSTVGKILGEKLPYSHIDLDHKIEEFFNMSVADIFSELGEHKFRECEEAYFCEKAKIGGYIVSTGGGTIMSIKNRRSLSKNGLSILLKTDPNIIASRIRKPNKRPLLANSKNMAETLKKLWHERKSIYLDCADIVICNDELTPVETANLICQKIS